MTEAQQAFAGLAWGLGLTAVIVGCFAIAMWRARRQDEIAAEEWAVARGVRHIRTFSTISQ